MPPDADSRRVLLERIITAGDRRRRRWLLGSGMALAVSTLSIAMLTGGHETQLAVTDDPTASSSTSSTTEPTSDTSPDTTEPTPSSTTEAPPATTSTTEQPPVCRNSTDPRCGPFYWDYDPATWPNKPLEISVTSSPATVVAGEPVTFSIRFFDPDVAGADNCAHGWFQGSSPGTDDDMGYSFADGEYDFTCAMPGCAIQRQPYGPWDPPPPAQSEPRIRTVSRVYAEPGDYTVQVRARTEWFCNFSGYNSQATITVPVHVVSAPVL